MLLSVYLILRNYLSKFFILLIKMNIENIGHFTAGYIFFVQRLLLTDLQLKFLFFFLQLKFLLNVPQSAALSPSHSSQSLLYNSRS